MDSTVPADLLKLKARLEARRATRKYARHDPKPGMPADLAHRARRPAPPQSRIFECHGKNITATKVVKLDSR